MQALRCHETDPALDQCHGKGHWQQSGPSTAWQRGKREDVGSSDTAQLSQGVGRD